MKKDMSNENNNNMKSDAEETAKIENGQDDITEKIESTSDDNLEVNQIDDENMSDDSVISAEGEIDETVRIEDVSELAETETTEETLSQELTDIDESGSDETELIDNSEIYDSNADEESGSTDEVAMTNEWINEPSEDVYAGEEHKKKRNFLKFLIIPVILGAAYLGGAFYFSSHAMPRTSVNGRDVAMQQISTIDPLDGVEIKPITITKKDGEQVVLKTEEIDLKLKTGSELEIKQDPFRWPLSLFEDDKYEVEILTEYDEAKLKTFIEDNFVKGAVKPEDAKMERVNGVYEIIPEVEGNYIARETLTEKLMDTIKSNAGELDLTELYEQPKLRKDDSRFAKAKEEIDKYTNKELEIDFIFKKEKMDRAVLSDFISVDKDLKVTYDTEKLHEYVVNLAKQYDTYGTYRTFESTNRGTIEVPPGIYGWQMDVDETEKLISKSLEEGTKEITPIYTIEGTMRTETGGDIGSTYIEVDLSNQHMWYYENGELIISAPVVTGDPTRGVATPPGVNVVWHKERNKPLEGIDPSGAPYVAPVDYWMAVDWSHTGIHNARWRENAGGFGGNIFRGNGSFGCINTPYYEVSVLYDRVLVGTPVIMYE